MTQLATDATIEQLNESLENFKDQRFAAAQARSAREGLEQFDGTNIESFRQGLDLLNACPLDAFSLLDVGCGIGFYGLLFKRYATKRIEYQGCDFSPSMVVEARKMHPECAFQQADARSLPHADKSVDVVWISALLEHVPEADQVLAEAARVGREYIMLHRLFLHDGPTTRQVVVTKPNEYPFGGFSYPRTVRNTQEFDHIVGRFGTIVRRTPWGFDTKNGKNLVLYSYLVELG